MRKNILLCLLCFLFCGTLMVSCGRGAKAVYRYENAPESDVLEIKKATYYNDKIILHGKNDLSSARYVSCYDENHQMIERDFQLEVKENQVIVKGKNMEQVCGMNISGNSVKCDLRYLNTAQYAILWGYWADDLGFDIQGDRTLFYTEEERANQEAKRQEYLDLLETNFSKLEGCWATDSEEETLCFFRRDDQLFMGKDYFDENNEYINEEVAISSIDMRENEEGIAVAISYADGPLDGRASYIMSNDEKELNGEYGNLIYKKSNMTYEKWSKRGSDTTYQEWTKKKSN